MRSGSEFESYTREARLHLVQAFGVLFLVVFAGTVGFCWVEGWSIWKSIFFTLVTVTTVGYGDEGISDDGKKLAVGLLLVGVAAATYGFGQLVQSVLSYRQAWRFRMQKVIATLENHVIVCGLGAVGRQVCEELLAEKTSFVAVDQDHDRCHHAQEHDILVLQGDATDDDVLRRAGVERAQSVVCAMSDDSANIVTTLSARELNPEITIVGRASEDTAHRKVQRAGATHVVLPAHSGAVEIANLLLRPQLAQFLQSAPDSDSYRLAEFRIASSSELIGSTLRELGMSEPNVTFVSHRRGDAPDEGRRPSPTTVLESGDSLILVGSPDELLRIRQKSSAAEQGELVTA